MRPNKNFMGPMMKKTIAAVLLPLALSACVDSGPSLTSQEKYVCTQCHKLPFPDKHPAAEWPAVVARMEAYMQANGRRMPTPQEREDIIKFYQARALN